MCAIIIGAVVAECLFVQEFTRPVLVKDWQHFLRNSERVRVFQGKFYGGLHRLISTAVIEIAKTRTVATVFPNLRAIYASTDELDLIYMSCSVTKLHLSLNYTPDELLTPLSYTALFRHMADRMPRITILELWSWKLSDIYHENITGLIDSLPELQIVMLPRYFFTTRIAHSLSRLRHLQEINMQFDDVEGDELALSASMTPKCTLEEGAFPKLSVITFSASTVPDILAFFTQPAFPLANLTVVWVHAPIVPDPSHVEALFADLLRAVPSMVDLSLGLLRLSYTGPSDLEDVKPLTLRTILPVTRWSSLRSFSVSHPRPISLTDDEVEAFARALHVDFEELLLNPNPLIATPPTLTLKAFLPIASRFRKLKELGLYFDATIVPPRPTSHRGRFAPDLVFWVGRSYLPVSPLSSYATVARFLALFIPVETTWYLPGEGPIFTRFTSDWLDEMSGSLSDVKGFKQGWKLVQAMVLVVLEERKAREEAVQTLTQVIESELTIAGGS